MKIVIVEQDKVDLYETQVNRLLAALGHPEALVTDLSQVFDFDPDEEAEADLSELMGRTVRPVEYLWQLAQELAAAGENKSAPLH
jgi:hypothetical protein